MKNLKHHKKQNKKAFLKSCLSFVDDQKITAIKDIAEYSAADTRQPAFEYMNCKNGCGDKFLYNPTFYDKINNVTMTYSKTSHYFADDDYYSATAFHPTKKTAYDVFSPIKAMQQTKAKFGLAYSKTTKRVFAIAFDIDRHSATVCPKKNRAIYFLIRRLMKKLYPAYYFGLWEDNTENGSFKIFAMSYQNAFIPVEEAKSIALKIKALVHAISGTEIEAFPNNKDNGCWFPCLIQTKNYGCFSGLIPRHQESQKESRNGKREYYSCHDLRYLLAIPVVRQEFDEAAFLKSNDQSVLNLPYQTEEEIQANIELESATAEFDRQEQSKKIKEACNNAKSATVEKLKSKLLQVSDLNIRKIGSAFDSAVAKFKRQQRKPNSETAILFAHEKAAETLKLSDCNIVDESAVPAYDPYADLLSAYPEMYQALQAMDSKQAVKPSKAMPAACPTNLAAIAADPNAFSRRRNALLHFCRQEKRVVEPDEALAFYKNNKIHSGDWYDNEKSRADNFESILKYIAKSFDPAKCGKSIDFSFVKHFEDYLDKTNIFNDYLSVDKSGKPRFTAIDVREKSGEIDPYTLDVISEGSCKALRYHFGKREFAFYFYCLFYGSKTSAYGDGGNPYVRIKAFFDVANSAGLNQYKFSKVKLKKVISILHELNVLNCDYVKDTNKSYCYSVGFGFPQKLASNLNVALPITKETEGIKSNSIFLKAKPFRNAFTSRAGKQVVFFSLRDSFSTAQANSLYSPPPYNTVVVKNESKTEKTAERELLITEEKPPD